MIKLVTGDGISINVPEGSVLYKALSRFVGEVFVVESDEKQEEPKKKEVVEEKVETLPEYIETEPVSVNAREYLEKINTFYPDEKSVVRSILYNHYDKFFGLSSSKVGNYAAVSSTVNKDIVTLVRSIGSKTVYATVPKGFVKPI